MCRPYDILRSDSVDSQKDFAQLDTVFCSLGILDISFLYSIMFSFLDTPRIRLSFREITIMAEVPEVETLVRDLREAMVRRNTLCCLNCQC